MTTETRQAIGACAEKETSMRAIIASNAVVASIGAIG